MAEITNEKQAIEAVENGEMLYDIPDEFCQLESVTLAAVKNDGNNLQYVDRQTFEICVAAFQNAGEDVLKYVDPELRTVDLLQACKIDVEDYDYFEDGKFRYISDVFWGDADNTTVYKLCAKGKEELLPYAQRRLCRLLAAHCHDEWKDIWCNNPADAEEYSLEFAPDKKSFTMTFNFGFNDATDFADFAGDSVLDDWVEACSHLKIFLYAEIDGEYESACKYWILDTG